jgi:HAMP domain-containing protein
MLQNLKLGFKLNLILLSVFLIIILINGLVLSNILQKKAEQEVQDKALVLMETMLSVREYTAKQVNEGTIKKLSPNLEIDGQFIKTSVPGYSAREVFRNLQKRELYSDFFYKEATLNPTYAPDKADKEEVKIVEKFRSQPTLKEQVGFRTVSAGNLFYIARPLQIKSESCLVCHSTPEQAPASQIKTYGDKGGFGWKLNEIVGAQIIIVPASKVFAEARRLQLLVIGILVAGFIVAAIILNLFLKFSIISPLKKMSKWSRDVSTGTLDADFEHKPNDEIGVLAASVNRLKVSLEMAMNMLGQNPEKS